MDSTLASGTVASIQESDFRALDLVGYDVATVPEPVSLISTAMVIVLLAGYGEWRRRLAA